MGKDPKDVGGAGKIIDSYFKSNPGLANNNQLSLVSPLTRLRVFTSFSFAVCCAQVEKHRKGQVDAEAALNAREAALKELSKEGGRVDKERRAGEAEQRARDVRLQRALEEVEKYKNLLGEVKAQVLTKPKGIRSVDNACHGSKRNIAMCMLEVM